jgi:hypothetical protein
MEIQRTALEELKSKLLRRAERLERELQQIERGERIANERAYARLVDKLCRVAYSVIALEKETLSQERAARGEEASEKKEKEEDLSLLLKKIQEARNQGDKKQVLKLIKKTFSDEELGLTDDYYNNKHASAERRRSSRKKRLWIKQK